MDDEILARVESQRLELEANITKLKKSLHHWQTLELDYEGLREEFHLLPEDTPSEKCLQVAREFGAELVDEKDLQSLLKDAKSLRTPQQLAHLLSKRVDYVAKNVETIRKQVVDAEKKRNVLLLAEDPEHQDEAGLPLSEITEELDNSGNVISSKVDRPGSEAGNLLDALEKVGVDGIKKNYDEPAETDVPSSEKATVGSSANASVDLTDLVENLSDDEDLSTDDEDSVNKLAEPSKPLNPYDTADEARLREEMLKYQGLDEVGAIVAELDLAEGTSDEDYDPDDDDLLIGSEEEEDESEDETGKAKHLNVSEGYKKKMEELEKKLGLTDLTNFGPDANLPPDVTTQLDRPPAAEAARKAALARHESVAKSSLKKDDEAATETKTKKPKKKSVAFADAVDVAKEETPSKKQKLPYHPKSKPAINPVGDSVIERTDSVEDTPPAPPTTTPKKVSRFKKDRQASNQPKAPPQPRPLIAPQVIEHPSSSDPTAYEAPDPSTIDDEMHRRQIALEYHKLRNRRIHAQGGFTEHLDSDGEEEDFDDAMRGYGIVDPETGNVRKVSRFKAARVRG